MLPLSKCIQYPFSLCHVGHENSVFDDMSLYLEPPSYPGTERPDFFVPCALEQLLERLEAMFPTMAATTSPTQAIAGEFVRPSSPSTWRQSVK